MLRHAPCFILLLTLAAACGPGTDDATSGGSSGTTQGPSTTAATETTTPTTSASTDGSTGAGGSTTAVTAADTGDPSSTSAATADTGTSAGSTGDLTTGVVVGDFERFKQSKAAGPCAPNADCDGFVELLASRKLRVEPFGEVGNPVIEADVSEEDFLAAVAVFADPALVALLDGPDPACNPPTDIFESMLLELGGVTHDVTTTACQQPPIAAAREMAGSLVTKYVP